KSRLLLASLAAGKTAGPPGPARLCPDQSLFTAVEISQLVRHHPGDQVSTKGASMKAPPGTLPAPKSRARLLSHLLRQLCMSRWTRRLAYVWNRYTKALKVLQVRLWRKPLIRLYYARTDYAPPPCMITLRLTSNCNLRCVQCGQWGEQGVFTR